MGDTPQPTFFRRRPRTAWFLAGLGVALASLVVAALVFVGRAPGEHEVVGKVVEAIPDR